ncbi:Hpt domain-containing protein [Thermodesulfobacteriota bacterium B35]
MSSSQDLSAMSMLDLFRMEAENHCATLADELLVLENNPDDAGTLASLMRAAHSLKGAARIVDLTALVGLTHAMEDIFVAAQEGRLRLDADTIDLLFAGVDLLGETASLTGEELPDWLKRRRYKVEQLEESYRQLAENSHDKAEKKPPPGDEPAAEQEAAGPDPGPDRIREAEAEPGERDLSALSMMDLFRQEVESHSQALADNLLLLEQNRDNDEAKVALMRAAHSIKGAARIVDLEPVVNMAHAMEDLFVAGQEGRVSLEGDLVDRLLAGVDLLAELAGQTDAGQEQWLHDRLQTMNELAHAYREAATTKNGQVADDGGAAGQTTPSAVSPAARPAKAAVVPETRAPDQSLRISAEGLNRLMGLAGEVQVEARWLPTFALKMLQLKHRQDKIYRLLSNHLDTLYFDSHAAIPDENNVRNLLRGMDDCRKMVNECLVEIEDHARRSTEISHHLHQEVIANRMRPFSDWTRGFPRMVRDLARELGKKVEFEIIGADTLVDRDILDKIESPLNHLIRNALDHGIEPPDERLQAGKPEKARLRLEARHSAGMLSIVVSDDGRGIDLERLRQTIIARKMIAEEMALELNENELLEFLFLPNFSTRKEVSKISGRGVGLDVVHSAVHEVRGIIRTSTRAGRGTTFEMQLPLTLSVTRSLLVEISGEDYAFPLVAIDHVLKLRPGDVKEVEGRQYVTFNQERIGLISARQVLEKGDSAETEQDNGTMPVLVLSDRHNRYGLIVDSFIGIRDLVVHSLDRRLQNIQDINAAAILEDGTPVLIIDVEDMVRSIDHLISGNRLQRIDQEDQVTGRQLKRILVVDDSITVREVERKMLSARGYDVRVAVDGQDGWNTLRKERFDLLITDVDMPRMDGIELVTTIRGNKEFQMLPIIIVSYKDRQEDRNRGLEAGADYYLTKGSFQDETLVRAVEELIGGPEPE